MARYEERDESYDLLNQYLQEIARVPRLTPERERELGKRVQENDPMTHAEIDCLRGAGRIGSFRDTVLYSTLMPCYLCAGAVVQFGIPKVIVGESRTFSGAVDFMTQHGVQVIDLRLVPQLAYALHLVAHHLHEEALARAPFPEEPDGEWGIDGLVQHEPREHPYVVPDPQLLVLDIRRNLVVGEGGAEEGVAGEEPGGGGIGSLGRWVVGL